VRGLIKKAQKHYKYG